MMVSAMKKLLSNQRGFAHAYLLLALVLIIIGLIIASKLQVVKTYSLKDTSNIQGVVLAKEGGDSGSSGSSGSGDSDSSESEDETEDETESGSSGSNSSGSGGSPTPTESRTESKTITPAGTRIETKAEPQKQKTKIRFGEGEKIKTEVKEGRTRVDVYSGGVKVRYEVRDGRVIIKAETEEGGSVSEQELFKIEDRLGRTGIKVATEGGKLVVARGEIGALSNFPLQVDLNTNQLIASTSAGSRVLTILPDQAVQNMLAANVISRLDPAFLKQAAESGGLTSVSGVITLGERNGVPVYEINGLKDQRLLRFIPVTTPIRVIVSAETGQIIAQEQSLLANIVDVLSP